MGFLDMFRQKTAAEQLRENKRLLDRSIRELDRERAKMEAYEKQTINEMKKLAKAGQKEACKIKAKDVVRTRAAINKFYMMRSQLQSVSTQMMTMKSQQAMNTAMVGITKSMHTMNRQMNLPSLQNMMMEFDKQSSMAEMKQEMVDDIMDDVLGADQEEEEADEMVSKVFDEIGISFADSFAPTPSRSAQNDKERSAMAEGDAELQARLDNLRKL